MIEVRSDILHLDRAKRLTGPLHLHQHRNDALGGSVREHFLDGAAENTRRLALTESERGMVGVGHSVRAAVDLSDRDRRGIEVRAKHFDGDPVSLDVHVDMRVREQRLPRHPAPGLVASGVDLHYSSNFAPSGLRERRAPAALLARRRVRSQTVPGLRLSSRPLW